MANEDDVFASEVDGVKPLEQPRAEIKKVAETTPGTVVRRHLAVANRAVADPLASQNVPMLHSSDLIEYRGHGVQLGVYRKLRLGQYEIEARLDLHRMTVEHARKEVFSFIQECYKYELRTVLILHGKGERNADNIALLKSHLAVWLPQIDNVLAAHSAQKHHGGTGAVYVLLKKGERSKQFNREVHGLK